MFKFQELSQSDKLVTEAHIPVWSINVLCPLKQLCVIFAAFIRGLLQRGHLLYVCLFNRCCHTDEDVCLKDDNI